MLMGAGPAEHPNANRALLGPSPLQNGALLLQS